MKLVIGLGNPGREYAATRHNVGFDLVDQLAARLGWIAKPEQFDTLARTKFNGLVMDGSISLASGGSEKLLLAKPMTYMNLSGRTVQAAMGFYQLTPADPAEPRRQLVHAVEADVVAGGGVLATGIA